MYLPKFAELLRFLKTLDLLQKIMAINLRIPIKHNKKQNVSKYIMFREASYG